VTSLASRPVQAEQGEPRTKSGRPGIVAWSWATTVLFAAVAVPVAVGASALEGVAIAVSLTLFAASLVVWTYAFGLAVVRSSRGDDINVPSLFFLSSGAAPAPVRRHLMASLTVSIVIAIVTVKANPFSALVPMMPLGLAGLWSARHGTFPPRAKVNRMGSPASRRADGRPGQ
jgi:hypothetical protein